MANISGHCLCGNVTYSADAEPVAQALCHCEDCQRQTGTAFSIVIGVPTDAFTVEGDTLSWYETTGAVHGTPTRRHFCSNCGSPIFSSVEVAPNLVYIKAGTLDDPSWLVPTMEVFTRSAQPWAPRLHEGMKFETMPGV
jgi:hypothetical protein